MRVSRSLTIKQMAIVLTVAMIFVLIFCVILLFHFVQQERYNTTMQLESIARSAREPLSAAILKADIPQAESILNHIQPAGIVSRADVVLPNQFQALRVSFGPKRPVPVMITRLFELPVQISLPLYSLERPVNPQPLAYLVLQADPYRMYRFVTSALSTLVTAYFLLTLMVTIAITWCINRLIVHPLRKIARELNDLPPHGVIGHQLRPPPMHHDDEIGLLVRGYNRNQKALFAAFGIHRTGKNQIPFFNPSQTELWRRKLTEQSDIHNIPDKHQITIWLQPHVSMSSGKVLSASVLPPSDNNQKHPDELTKETESCDTRVTSGYQVLEESCRQLASWQSRGVMMPLSVTLPARQLTHPGLVTRLLELPEHHGIKAGTLILELTESHMIDDPYAMVTILCSLRNAGIPIALDDIRPWYPGLRQIRHIASLPVDIIKIDKMFIDDLPVESSMVSAIIMMARGLKLHIIAQGVETEAQRDWLRQTGVEIAQGTLFARAVPVNIFEQRYLPEENQDEKI